jgi:hypothetical protein
VPESWAPGGGCWSSDTVILAAFHIKSTELRERPEAAQRPGRLSESSALRRARITGDAQRTGDGRIVRSRLTHFAAAAGLVPWRRGLAPCPRSGP